MALLRFSFFLTFLLWLRSPRKDVAVCSRPASQGSASIKTVDNGAKRRVPVAAAGLAVVAGQIRSARFAPAAPLLWWLASLASLAAGWACGAALTPDRRHSVA